MPEYAIPLVMRNTLLLAAAAAAIDGDDGS
jgi:hypothetical protein